MSPRLKVILSIISFIALILLIAWGLYTFFQKTAPNGQIGAPTDTTSGTQGTLPGAGNRTPGTNSVETGATAGLPVSGINAPPPPTPSYFRPAPITKITNDVATNPSINTQGALRYYNTLDGKFYRIAPDGSTKELSDQVFYNAQNVTWASAKDRAVIEYPDNSKIVYDFDTKKQATLPRHWQDFSFSPTADQIAAKSVASTELQDSTENNWLVVTGADGKNTQLIEPMGTNSDKVIVDWSPSRQAVAFSKTGDTQGLERQEILLVGTQKENFRSLLVEGRGFEPNWSTTGKRIMYSVYSSRSNFNPELWVVSGYGDDIGSNRHLLQLNTWAHKCTFVNDDTAYCAVPRLLPQGSALAPEIAADVPDDLYKIDLNTGLKTNIPLGTTNYTMNNLSFDQTNNKLFFTDTHQSGIFQVNG